MTIVKANDLQPDEINHLGHDLAHAIKLDHEAAQKRSLTAIGEVEVDFGD